MVKQLPAGTKMNFTTWCEGLEFGHVVATAGEPVVPSLKSQPSPGLWTIKAVAATIVFGRRVMSVHHSHHAGERG